MAGVERSTDPARPARTDLRDHERATFTAICIAGAHAVAAVLLIATTIRLSAFSDGRETRHHALVGASNRFIETPFILEGVLAALIGSLLAGGADRGARAVLRAGLPLDAPRRALVEPEDALLVVPILLGSGACWPQSRRASRSGGT
jgi:cell division transport system permease protein